MRGREAKRYKLLFPTFLTRDNNTINITYAKSDETFQLNMMTLFNSIKFKGRYTYSVFQAAIKDSQLLMGGAATFKYLEEDSLVTSDDSKPVTAKIIQRHIRANSIDKLIDCEGIRTAIRLEKAVIEWELYDKKYGVLGQYINLLVREGCLVSKQLESHDKKTYQNKNTAQKYFDKTQALIKNTLNYHGPLKTTSKSSLYNALNRIKLGQRILSCHLKASSNQVTISTESLLTTVFGKYGFNFQTANIVLSRNDCINMYDFIVQKIYASNSIDAEIEKLFEDGMKASDRSKYIRVKSLLSLFFNVTSPKRGSINLARNKALDDSIRNMTNIHKHHLYNK
jgi:DNA-binding PadR family transcriptional regulator